APRAARSRCSSCSNPGTRARAPSPCAKARASCSHRGPMIPQRASKPWYREPWPWFLIAGPAVVVLAGVITTVLAVRSSDGVVADDYYKQGLGINRTLERDARAQALGIAATVQFNEERSAARVTL